MKFCSFIEIFYVTYESLTMLYMNCATWTKSVVWNVQPKQYKTSFLLLTFTVNVWGEAVSVIYVGGGQGTLVGNKWGKLHFIICLVGSAMA